MLVMAMILQSFDVKLDDPNYELKIKQSLTIKPDDLYIRVTPRKRLDATAVDKLIHTGANGHGTADLSDRSRAHANGSASLGHSTAKPITILYGSNTGTCQAFAQQVSSQATARGFSPRVVNMDSATNAVPTSHPTVFISSSYEGLPPENAARFVEWLQSLQGEIMTDVQYTVFGCGHSECPPVRGLRTTDVETEDWSRTFHRIPKLVDELLSRHGAKRYAPVGFADAAKGNLQGEFEDWLDASLWPNLVSAADDLSAVEDSGIVVELSANARASTLRHDVGIARVLDNRLLTKPGEPAKWHMDIELPSTTIYECGDYLAVLPLNSERMIKRIMAHFGLPWDAVVTIRPTSGTFLPVDTPLSVFDVLKSYVELSQPATKKVRHVLFLKLLILGPESDS
jgi:cytochrome P450 / NADPH-cytochrome P450 reductase